MSKFRNFFEKTVGIITWNPPGWGVRLISFARNKPRVFCASLLLLAAVGAGGCFAYSWYQHLPKPYRVSLTATPIPVTPLNSLVNKLTFPSLVLNFSDSTAPLSLVNQVVTEGVRIDPAVAGTWRWNGDRQLTFTPSADWPADKQYHVTLAKEAVSPHVLLDHYAIDVSTPPFEVSVRKFEFYQDPTNPEHKQVVATLDFTHSIVPGELEKNLTFKMLGGFPVFGKANPQYTVNYGPFNRVAYISTAQVELPEREDFLKLGIDKSLCTSQGGAALKQGIDDKVRIPDRYSFFKIDSLVGNIARKDDGDPEQILIVNTSSPAKTSEIAKALEVYLLPKMKAPQPVPGNAPSDTGDEVDSDDNYEQVDNSPTWQSPREVSDGILKDAQPVQVTAVPSEQEFSTQHLFKIHVGSTGSLYAKIKGGVKAEGGFQLKDDFDAVLAVPKPPVEITIQGDGGILALNGEHKLSVESRGVSMIDYEIARVPDGEINHLVSQTEGNFQNFQNPEFLTSFFDQADIARFSHEQQSINMGDPFRANYSLFDFSSHLKPATGGGGSLHGLFFLTARGLNAQSKKYLREVSAQRFVLVTDIGILMKENTDGTRDVFLASLSKGVPLGGVSVEILARNGRAILSAQSDAQGHVQFAALGKPARQDEPVAIVASQGSDVAFIPFSRSDRRINYSRFDVGGVENLSGADLDAFVFTERGIYRPGDEIHAAFAVKQHNWGGNLAGLPVETEVVDARGTSVQVKKVALDASGFSELTYDTRYSSPSGNYTINIWLLKNGERSILLGSTSVLVKEFRPDRLKITAKLIPPPAQGWIKPEKISADITLRNLYGTPATGRRVVARMSLMPTSFQFEQYRDYSFFDALRDRFNNPPGENVELGETTTDTEGATHFDLNLERFTSASYQMNFDAEGFEADGGRSVHADCSALVSPLAYVIGSKNDTDAGTIDMNSDHKISFIAVANTLKKIALSRLQLNVVQEETISVLAKQEDGTYGYQSVRKESIVHTEEIAIPEEGLNYTLPTGKPGDYFIELREKDSGLRVCMAGFHVTGIGNVSKSPDKNAELLLKLDRQEYNPGEEMELSITTPYTGYGLITIERDKVYSYQWFRADQNSTAVRVKVPEGFDGTGYVNVAFVRSLDSKEILKSPLSYGVVPFTANKEKHRLTIALHADKLIRPGKTLTIFYKTDHPAKIVIYAVDEGILQVTNYKLPDPLGYFFRKQALMVKTSQILDLLMPEYSLLRSSAFGGGGDDTRQLNPFRRITEKPVVFWSGILDSDATERAVTYDVPDYFNGNLTLMAVAVSPDAVGSVQQDTVVQGPFVLTPSVPTFVAPGDQFEIGVTVANNVKGSGTNAEVRLVMDTNDQLTIVKSPDQPLHIPEGKEITTTFTVRANEKLGSANMRFTASGAGESASLNSTLSIRPPSPLMTQVNGGHFSGREHEVEVDRKMYAEFRDLKAVISATPLGLARGLESYLKNYPNGCSEQLTSGAMARLLLSDEADFGLRKEDLLPELEKTFDLLRSRQNAQGGFGYWSASSTDDIDFISTYVMHFLIECKAAGIEPPTDMLQSGLRNLQRMVIKEPHDLEEARTLAYAIYLLTREEVITTNYILNLRDTLDEKFPKQWQNDLTGVYLAGSLALLKNNEDAEKLIRSYTMGKKESDSLSDFYQPLGEDSQYLAIIARHFPEMLSKITDADFEAIAEPINSGEFNTLSAAYAVLALKSYSQHMASLPGELSISEVNADKQKKQLNAPGKLLRCADFSENATAIIFGAEPPIGGPGAYYQMIETGFDKHSPEKKIADGMEVYREILDASGNKVTTARIGETLTVRIRIRSLGSPSISNVAIVDLFPSGFEVIDSSLPPGLQTQGCDFVEVREDRAIFFTTISADVHEITYQIKPCNKGEFIVPPIFAESMYDRSLKSRDLPSRIRVLDGVQ